MNSQTVGGELESFIFLVVKIQCSQTTDKTDLKSDVYGDHLLFLQYTARGKEIPTMNVCWDSSDVCSQIKLGREDSKKST